jgi:AcrR family transcriptional regulator
MVNAILEAAAREFVGAGYAGATTKRIAEIGGISVGSLYQYFPSKEAIAVELARRYRASRVEFARKHLEAVGEESLDAVVPTLFAAFLKAEGIRPEVYRILIDEVLRTTARTELRGFEEDLEVLVAAALRRMRPPPRVDDVDTAAFLLVRLVHAVVQAANADKPRLNTPALATEMTTMVLRYLRGG